MGTIKNGILGGFSGIVGPVVGANWRGIDYMRSLPAPRTTPSSPGEDAQKAKFSLTSTFLQPMKELLKVGFKSFAVKKTGANAAHSYALKNAVAGTYPDIYIVCNEVLVCRGDLPNVKAAVAVSDTTDQVRFTWTDNSGIGKAGAADKAILVVLCHELDHCAYTLTGAPRSAGTDILHVQGFSGKEVQTWLSFISKDNKDIASSLFTGQFIIA